MADPLRAALGRLDRPDPVLGAEDLAPWPAGALDALARAGLVAEAAVARSAACDACGGDHVEEVIWDRPPGATPRAFVPCPENGPVPIDPARLRRWAVRPAIVAGLVATAIGAVGPVEERVVGRAWRLGSVRVGGRVRVGWLVRGLRWADGPAVAGAVPELWSPAALVFVPVATPPAAVWATDRRPPVVPLIDLLTLGPDGVTTDPAALDAAVTPPGRVVPAPVAVAPLPPGATWEDITLAVEDRHLTVRVGAVSHRLGYAEAGFEDGRTGGPNQGWELLRLLARRNGELTHEGPVRTKSAALKRAVSDLRASLRRLTGLPTDPIDRAGRGRAYRARFRVTTADGVTIPTPPGTTWGRVAVAEAAVGVVVVSVDAGRTGVRRAGPDGWEAVAESGERSTRLAVADLGLSDPGRDALLATLRAGGSVRRRSSDRGMRDLCGGLTHLLGIDGSPFEYLDGTWTARFEAKSIVPASDR